MIYLQKIGSTFFNLAPNFVLIWLQNYNWVIDLKPNAHCPTLAQQQFESNLSFLGKYFRNLDQMRTGKKVIFLYNII